ncbi:hypothetical protein NLJ89_g1360 [Agrocybe chaxingu]|uniref:lytic cellulose monooxygenase (C4-dehydrogenating) n=1 Tax=Agrocybe chaxingu TaxID=84603 RepID=A0A9W8TEI5_9AGAR|nr:hypothetical protein NLJ89_g1360 [Agrocybe chaxingu]
MLKPLLFTAIISAVVTTVYGHGYVQEIVSGSAKYTGYLPYQDPYMNPAPQRIALLKTCPLSSDIFLTFTQVIANFYPSVQCNGWSQGGVVGSAPAPIFATFAAGSSVSLNWTTWPDSHVGPVITYMARAPSDITKWNPGSSAVWFKVAESGKTSDGRWAATDLLYASNHIYTFRIPPRLQPGQYIIRHEIIALHSAYSYPGAQVYPSCIQVQVTDKGAYPIPGPAVWTGGN